MLIYLVSLLQDQFLVLQLFSSFPLISHCSCEIQKWFQNSNKLDFLQALSIIERHMGWDEYGCMIFQIKWIFNSKTLRLIQSKPIQH